jgi:hypothetical protein
MLPILFSRHSRNSLQIQSNLIERLEIWRKENGTEETSLQEVATQRDEPPEIATTTPSEIFPEQIKYYKSRTIWSVDAGVNLDNIASDKDLKELEDLTGCQFVKVLDEHKIYIGGHFEESCHLAILKLDNLRKYHVSQAIFVDATFTDHLPAANGTTHGPPLLQ